MIRIFDHLKEKEEVLQYNLRRARAALDRKERVVIYHPIGAIHGRLSNLPGAEYVPFAALGRREHMPAPDKWLLGRLTTLNEYRMPGEISPKGEIFIHWFYRKRKEDRLGLCEIFHMNMLRTFNVMDRVEAIHIRCAYDGKMTKAMQEAVSIMSEGHAEVDFRIVPQAPSWEHDTIKEAVEYAVATGKFVYYAHFKGVTHIEDPNILGGYRNGSRTDPGRHIRALDILYWSYLMYRYMFMEAPKDAVAIGPLLHDRRPTLHYANGALAPKWSYPADRHYTGSFQAFDGEFLRKRFEGFGATRAGRNKELWVSDPYTVEQFLALCYRKEEVASLATVQHPYMMYTEGFLPEYRRDFEGLYKGLCKNICVANGTYKWIGGTDTFNWALCKAFIRLGYTVYYYAPDMDGDGVTEKHLKEIGVLPYNPKIPLAACFANQQSGKAFVDRCPVVQTCHSAYTALELPINGASGYVSISEEIHDYLAGKGHGTVLLRNGIDLERFRPVNPLRETPKVLSLCQGDDSLLRRACARLGWEFSSVPKAVGERVWDVERLINQADIVAGIGRSLYDAMACGRVCISWDNRKLNPYCGCGYVTKDNWHLFARTNFTGRGFPAMDSEARLMGELRKYNPADGADMREIAERELNADTNALIYLRLAGICDNEP